MPKKFDKEIADLKAKLITMGELAQSMTKDAMRSLVDRDEKPIRNVQVNEEKLDALQVEIDDEAVRAMATFGPVALDLRFLLMAARISTELERVGDQAVNMCENVQLLLSEPQLKPLVDLPRMAETAARMVKQSLQAFVEGSPEKALEVIKADDEVDALNHQIFRELLTYMLADPKTITRCLGLILTARAIERIADHATNIAEEVVFLVKGVDIRHQHPPEPDRRGTAGAQPAGAPPPAR